MQVRNLLVKYLFVLLFLSMSTASKSADFHRLYIFHINGINTTPEEAGFNKVRLAQAARVGYHMTTWALLYNETHGLIKSDLFDVLRQKNQEHEELNIFDYVDAYMQAHNLHYPFYSPQYWNLLNHLKEHYAKDLDFVGKNFNDILKQYHDIVAAGAGSVMSFLQASGQKKQPIALFVSHSQGGLYANSLIDYLIHAEKFPSESIGLYAFATPSSKLGSSTEDEDYPIYANHMTADNDSVISSLSGLARLTPANDKPIRSNVHLNVCKDNYLCHGLTTAYLANPEMVNHFCTDVNRVAGHIIAHSYTF